MAKRRSRTSTSQMKALSKLFFIFKTRSSFNHLSPPVQSSRRHGEIMEMSYIFVLMVAQDNCIRRR